MQYNVNDKDVKDIIPRSWYKDGTIYAVIYEGGNFFPSQMPGKDFLDTKSKWMEGTVRYMSAREVILGTSASTFEPDRNITRAEYVTMLMRMLNIGNIPQTYKGGFKDQAEIPSWALTDIDKARGLGLVKGDESYNFNPNDNIRGRHQESASHPVVSIVFLKLN